MKKIILFACALIGATASQAQNYQFLDKSDNSIDHTGTTVVVNGTDADVDLHKDFDIKNVSGSAKALTMKRYELTVDAGTKNYFCFVSCSMQFTAGTFNEPTDGPTPSIADGANSLFYLAAHHLPEGVTSSSSNHSKYLYVVYDDANPNDSAWVEVQFNIGAVGVEENTVGNLNNAYPNPATKNVTFNFDIEESNNNKIVIYDMLGAKVDELNVKGNAHNYNVEALKAGVYFYALEVNGKATKTKKLVIK